MKGQVKVDRPEEELKQTIVFRRGEVLIRKLARSRTELGNTARREGLSGEGGGEWGGRGVSFRKDMRS